MIFRFFKCLFLIESASYLVLKPTRVFWGCTLARCRSFSDGIQTFFHPLPYSKSLVFVASGVCVLSALLFSCFQHKMQMGVHEKQTLQLVQQKFNHLMSDVSMHFNFMAKVLSQSKQLENASIFTKGSSGIKSLPYSFEVKSGAFRKDTFEADELVLKREISGGEKTLVCRIPYSKLSECVGVSLLSNKDVYPGKIETPAGYLYYPYKQATFLSSFLYTAIPDILLRVAMTLSVLFVVFCAWALFVAKARSCVKKELTHYQREKRRLCSQNRSLSNDVKVLKKNAYLKEKSEDAYWHMKTLYGERHGEYTERATSLLTLLKHALRRDGFSSQVNELCAHLEEALGFQNGYIFESQASRKIDIAHVVDRVFDALAPLMERNGLKLQKNLTGGCPTIQGDPYLFELCLLVLCKEVASYAYEGATLSLHSCQSALSLTVIGSVVTRDSAFSEEFVDIGFMRFPRKRLPFLLDTLGFTLSSQQQGFEISFAHHEKKESHPHDNVISLFA